MIRFSLTTLLLVAFWLAALMLVWALREPWIPVSAQLTARPGTTQISPDWTRIAFSSRREVFIFEYPGDDVFPKNLIALVKLPVKLDQAEDPEFVNNDFISVSGKVSMWRRFPEWWWGHFYRPEVWLALALTGALLWRGLRTRRAARRMNA